MLFNVTYCGGRGASSGACYRSELSGDASQSDGFQYGTDYWFGFSLRLPDGYTLGKVNPQEEIHFQMHGSPNRDLHEAWRNPIFGLSVLPNRDYDRDGKQLPYSGKASWQVVARGDPRLNLTQRIKPDGKGTWDYMWENVTTIGPAVGGQWENFVYHTRQVAFKFAAVVVGLIANVIIVLLSAAEQICLRRQWLRGNLAKWQEGSRLAPNGHRVSRRPC